MTSPEVSASFVLFSIIHHLQFVKFPDQKYSPEEVIAKQQVDVSEVQGANPKWTQGEPLTGSLLPLQNRPGFCPWELWHHLSCEARWEGVPVLCFVCTAAVWQLQLSALDPR